LKRDVTGLVGSVTTQVPGKAPGRASAGRHLVRPFLFVICSEAMTELDQLVQAAKEEFSRAGAPADLENAKARYLGKAGRLTELLKALGGLSPEQKKTRGAEINATKQQVEALLADAELEAQLRAEALDVTLPGRTQGIGGLHPISRVTERIEAIFGSMGFDVADGPEIETDWYSFTALNNPENHPARSMQDTFYVDMKDDEGRWLNLRPHTSPMQIRYARAHARKYSGEASMPDIRVIAPGRTYRVDSDATHSPMFHQVEGLWVGESISFKDLRSVYVNFLQEFFETKDMSVRFRPSYFPFTEPSAEIDMMFGAGPLKGRWLELSGAGQVHPQVIRNMGLDPERYIGFAFGSGIDRLAMLRYGVSDLRMFFDGDLRFLSQFR
jgi:phenylalanyl-tRNA synthetase alpha chain